MSKKISKIQAMSKMICRFLNLRSKFNEMSNNDLLRRPKYKYLKLQKKVQK